MKDVKKSKDFVLYRDGYGMFRIKYEGGGEIPKALSGSYTDEKLAKRDIEEYEKNKIPCRQADRKVKNGAEKDSSK